MTMINTGIEGTLEALQVSQDIQAPQIVTISEQTKEEAGRALNSEKVHKSRLRLLERQLITQEKALKNFNPKTQRAQKIRDRIEVIHQDIETAKSGEIQNIFSEPLISQKPKNEVVEILLNIIKYKDTEKEDGFMLEFLEKGRHLLPKDTQSYSIEKWKGILSGNNGKVIIQDFIKKIENRQEEPSIQENKHGNIIERSVSFLKQMKNNFLSRFQGISKPSDIDENLRSTI